MKFNHRLSNYPTYRSPIRTFQELGISTENLDPNQLRIERKRLLLEIQISDTQTTQLADKELSKNDVIQLFDELERVSHLDYHTAIFKHPVLLTLLEDYTVSLVSIKKEHKIFFDTQEEWDQFIDFISPYLANAIDKLLSKVIRNVNFSDLDKIRPFFKLMLPQDAFYAFRKFNNFCQTLENRLETLSSKHVSFPVNESGFLRYPSFYDSVNEISKVYTNLADNVATDVINFTVNAERRVGRGKYLVAISDQARRLNCSAQLKTIIIGNRKAFANSKEEEASFNANFTWRLLVGLIIVGSLLFRATNRCSSNRTYDNPNQEMLDQFRNLQELRESNSAKPSRSKETSAPREFSFTDLHEHVYESALFSEYSDPSFIAPGDPAIFSKLNATDHGTRYQLTNETASDMVMVIGNDFGLTSHFLPSKETILFSTIEQADIFFYSGKNWSDSRTIQYNYLSGNSKEISKVQFNGYFSLWTPKDIEFTRKFFTLTDGESNQFRISEEKGAYELYQGDRHVNYSF